VKGDTAARNTGFALLTQLSTALFTAALVFFLGRALGPTAYGAFALAVGLSGLLVLPADFGISQAAARFVAEHQDDPLTVAHVLARALRIKLMIAAAVATGLFVLAAPIADLYGDPSLVWPMRGAALALFGQSIMQLGRVTFVALRRISTSLPLVFGESAIEFSASVALVLLGGGAAGATFGRAIGYLFGAVLAVVLIARMVGPAAVAIRGKHPAAPPTMMRDAGALLIIDGAFAAFTQLDVLLIGGLLGTTAAGLYAVPLRLTTLFAYPGLAVGQGVAPRQSRRSDEPPDVRSFQRALRVLLLVQTGIAVFAVVWAEPIIEITVGTDFDESVAVLRALGPFILLSGFAPLLSLALTYLGEARRRVPIALGAVALNVAIDLALIPQIGILAGAVGTDISFLLYVGAHFWICRRLLGISLRPLAVPAARAVLAAAVMALVLWAIRSGSESPAAFAAGLLAGPGAFVAVLVALGELKRKEIASVSQRLRRILQRS